MAVLVYSDDRSSTNWNQSVAIMPSQSFVVLLAACVALRCVWASLVRTICMRLYLYAYRSATRTCIAVVILLDVISNGRWRWRTNLQVITACMYILADSDTMGSNFQRQGRNKRMHARAYILLCLHAYYYLI
jgi:hypothetical protein